MAAEIRKTIIAALVTLATLFGLLMLYMIASGDRSLFSALASDQPAPRQNQVQTSPCAMAAADVRMFADDYQSGASLQDELQRYGNHDFRRSMIQQVYSMSDHGGTPEQIEAAALDQCNASTNN
jgi:hypothetical protein